MTLGFGGHFIPGFQFTVIGLWWIYSAWLRYFLCRQRKRTYYVTFPFPLLGFGSRIARLPLEPIYFLISAIVGFIIEITAGYNLRLDLKTEKMLIYFNADNIHHFSMYLLFFYLAIVELLVRYCSWIPKTLEMVAGAIAFAGLAFLFHFHSKTDDRVDGPIHSILFLTICATTFSIVFEILQQEKQIIATLMRGYFTMLQGAWFCLAGYYIDPYFNPEINRDDHHEMHRFSMLLAFYYILFVVIYFIVVFGVGWFAHYLTQRCVQKHDLIDSSQHRLMSSEERSISEST